MKNALIPVIVFSLAMITTTMWSVMKTPLPELPVNEFALADSLLADSLWRDSVATQHATATEPNEQAGRADDHSEISLATAAPTRVQTQDVADEMPAGEVVAAVVAENQEAYQALARIFARMKPAEAAEVLLHMSNEEVEGVVRNLGARQAASVLANLPEQRAAELARRLLNPAPGGGE